MNMIPYIFVTSKLIAGRIDKNYGPVIRFYYTVHTIITDDR
jgi:hypothetical protein